MPAVGSPDLLNAVFVPDAQLAGSTTYYTYSSGGFADLAGKTGNFFISFTTGP